MRYFIRLSYDGGSYHGWQRQPNASSVQETIEEALSIVLRSPTPIVGAGRTDTGVNARRMYAHFDTDKRIEDIPRMLNSLNRLCGREITIENIVRVKDDAHARFDAERRTYKYFVIKEKSSFQNRYTWHTDALLDIEAMNRAAQILNETKDFTSFAKLHSDAKTNICDVTEAIWQEYTYPTGECGYVFTITADRFLRNMVRAIVGTLLDVGRGKINIEDFGKIIERKDRCAAGVSMPATPLFLWDVTYPEDIYL